MKPDNSNPDPTDPTFTMPDPLETADIPRSTLITNPELDTTESNITSMRTVITDRPKSPLGFKLILGFFWLSFLFCILITIAALSAMDSTGGAGWIVFATVPAMFVNGIILSTIYGIRRAENKKLATSPLPQNTSPHKTKKSVSHIVAYVFFGLAVLGIIQSTFIRSWVNSDRFETDVRRYSDSKNASAIEKIGFSPLVPAKNSGFVISPWLGPSVNEQNKVLSMTLIRDVENKGEYSSTKIHLQQTKDSSYSGVLCSTGSTECTRSFKTPNAILVRVKPEWGSDGHHYFFQIGDVLMRLEEIRPPSSGDDTFGNDDTKVSALIDSLTPTSPQELANFYR